MLLIQHGTLYTMEDAKPVPADLLIKNGKIEKIAPEVLYSLHGNGKQICAQIAEGDWETNSRFPGGDRDMRRMTDEIHRRGMLAKLW